MGEVLHALTAQVRKLTVKSFISRCRVGAICNERWEIYAECTRDSKCFRVHKYEQLRSLKPKGVTSLNIVLDSYSTCSSHR